METLFGYIIFQLSLYSSNAYYDGRNQGYTIVPHENIGLNETEIDLETNAISQILPYEFSVYTGLTDLNLRGNEIRTVSASAFNGTQLRVLNIRQNKLNIAPDLAVVSGTIKHLDFRSNPLNLFPDFTLHVDGITLLVANNTKAMTGTASQICHISSFYWIASNLQSIPDISCESSNLHYLQLINNDINENCDFAALETISSSLKSLGLKTNKFTKFPDLPKNVRSNLRNLWLADNRITVVSEEAITGYNLYGLTLEDNRITAIPRDLFLVAQSINLAFNPLNDWDQHTWNEMICKRAYSLNTLDLSGSLSSLTQMPDIHHSICSTPTHETLTLILELIPGPCDCSVQWMADVAQQGCTLNLLTDTLQCGIEVGDMNLTCPKSGLVLYANENFTGDSYMVEMGGIVESWSVMSYAVLGEQAWIAHASHPDMRNKMLHPGRYSSKQEAGLFELK